MLSIQKKLILASFLSKFSALTGSNISVNSLSNDKTIDWPNFKAFADDNLNVAIMANLVFDRVENIAGKGENTSIFSFSQNVCKSLLSQGR